MDRICYQYLLDWQKSRARKPLLLRGARQVGKTHLIQQFAKEFENFVEINFEKQTAAKAIFAGDLSAKRLLRDINLFLEIPIVAGKTLLFLDEIQEIPRAITALRYFYEEMPDLHVIAAGSLLEFALESVGIPVGRVSFLHMYPMSFIEFLAACGHSSLAHVLIDNTKQAINEPIHSKLMELFFTYIAVGGMPEAIKCWIDTQDIFQVSNIHHQLVETFAQDFQKYTKKFQLKYVDLLFKSVPLQLGNSFNYSQISQTYRKRELEPCLELLEKAGIINRIYASAAQGIPLGAQSSLRIFKPLFLDIALAQTLLGVELKNWLLKWQETMINKGSIVEATIGQELLALADPRLKKQLYYWHRMERGSNAEVDYLLQQEQTIIPLEVKSGKAKQSKSMKLFLDSHGNSSFGLRLANDQYHEVEHLRTYPLYALVSILTDQHAMLRRFLTRCA